MLRNSFIKIVKTGIFISVIGLSGMFLGCSKEDQKQDKLVNKNISSEIKSVPYFEVAKGDSISKDIFREKPDFDNGDATILFSTETKLKASGTSSGTGPIRSLFASIRRTNDVGNWLWDDLQKIPVDLNEGAGGKYIYLFYSKKEDLALPIRGLGVIASNGSDGTEYYTLFGNAGTWIVPKDGGGWADLNDGAGGRYIRIIATREEYDNYNNHLDPIQDIMIVSSNSSTITYTGWTKINVDLNKEAGGKWIFLFYKR